MLHLDVNMLIKLVLVEGGRSSAQHLGSSVTEQADLKSVSDVSPLSSIEYRNSVETGGLGGEKKTGRKCR